MSGVGDNFQLHTLLADRPIGDPARGLLAADRPAPAWVAAATTEPPRLTAGNFILRRFRLFDATGSYVDPGGRPADIPLLEGARVIVLHPPLGDFGWTCGRTYEHMTPALTLDHVMTAGEADAWRARVAPARETDLFEPPTAHRIRSGAVVNQTLRSGTRRSPTRSSASAMEVTWPLTPLARPSTHPHSRAPRARSNSPGSGSSSRPPASSTPTSPTPRTRPWPCCAPKPGGTLQ
jgi:hypothetical protein